MARYVSLIRFTDQGARAVKKSAARALAFDKIAAKAGVKVETQLWTLGSINGVLILNGDEKNIIRCLAQLATLGNVRTESLRAFDVQELKSIVG